MALGMDEKIYVENKPLTLPTTVDGLTAIGDLWNCHDSSAVGYNLFGRNLSVDHLHADVVEDLQTSLIHVKGSTDKHKIFHVDGEISVELMAGLIKISGGGDYDKDDGTHVSEEELQYTYDRVTYVKKVLPAAKEVIDQLVLQKILKGEIKATHVVVNEHLGSKVTASIKIKDTSFSSKEDIKGHFMGKIPLGHVTASVKVALGMLDTSAMSSFQKTIKVDSKPAIDTQPTNIKEMFKVIESVTETMKTHVHSNVRSHGNSPICGVPLRFKLVPITQFVEVEVEKLYQEIKDDIIVSLTSILAFLRDCQGSSFLSKKVLERNSHLKTILLDVQNPLTVEICQREREICEQARGFYTKLAELLKLYKCMKADMVVLLKQVNEVNDELSLPNVIVQVEAYVKQGRSQLLGISAGDIEDTHKVKVFTNELDMTEWFQPQKPIKLLVRTGGSSIQNNFINELYNISSSLDGIGVQIGVAVPNISGMQFNATLKIGGEEEKVYSDKEMPHLIAVLQQITEKATPLSSRFFSLFATQNGIKLPFKDNLMELPSLVEFFKDIKKVQIAESYLRLRTLCLENDSRWKFLINMAALDSCGEAFRKFKYLRLIFGDAGGDWIVGSFGFETAVSWTDAPLLLVFKNEQLVAQCLDNLDTLILREVITSSYPEDVSEEALLDLLAPTTVNGSRNALVKSRANFAAQNVFKLLCHQKSIVQESTMITDVPGFPFDPEMDLRPLQVLIRSSLLKDHRNLLSSLCTLVTAKVSNFGGFLQESGWVQDGDEASNLWIPPSNLDIPQLLHDVQSFLQQSDPLYCKISNFLHITKKECKEDYEHHKELLDKLLEDIINDPTFPVHSKEQIILFKESPTFKDRIEKSVKELEKVINSSPNQSKFRNLGFLVSLLTILVKNDSGTPDQGLTNFLFEELLPSLANDKEILQDKHPDVTTQMKNAVNGNSYYDVLGLLSSVSLVNPQLQMVLSSLEKLTSLTDWKGLERFLRTMAEAKLSEEQLASVFGNSRVQMLLQRAMTVREMVQLIQLNFCSPEIPFYMPTFVAEEVKKIVNEDATVECPDTFATVQELLICLQRITLSGKVPDKFTQTLSKNLKDNRELFAVLKEAGALVQYNDETGYFTEAWDPTTVQNAHKRVLAFLKSREEEKITHIHIEMESQEMDHTLTWESRDVSTFNKAKGKWIHLLGPDSVFIDPIQFLKLSKLLSLQEVQGSSTSSIVPKLLPLVIQRMKMWGLNFIDTNNLSQILGPKKKTIGNASDAQSAVPGQRGRMRFGQKPTVKPADNSEPSGETCPLSRLDILTALFASCDHFVFQDLLKVMSQFPVALPLIVRDLSEEESWTCTASLLKCAVYKWESNTGVIYNQLFTDPYKIIAAVRVGSTNPKKSVGKSTILNQVLSNRNMFSSKCDPGSEHGKPLTLEGTVEMCVLTQETSSSSLWASVLKPHYCKGSNELVILANLHGDAMKHPQIVNQLKQMTAGFIVFFMPMTAEDMRETHEQLPDLLGTEDWIDILVDPTEECTEFVSEDQIVETNNLAADSTSDVTRSAIREALAIKTTGVMSRFQVPPLQSQVNKVAYVPDIWMQMSHELIETIGNLGCKEVKSLMGMQMLHPKMSSYQSKVHKIWKKDKNLRDILSKFVAILQLPKKLRHVALSHLDRGISQLSAHETAGTRRQIGELQEQRRRLMMSLEVSQNQMNEKQILEGRIKFLFQELDMMTLGMEHLYREIGRLFQLQQSSSNGHKKSGLHAVPQSCAEMLLQGHAIEVLDGDIMDMCGPWFNSICHSVCTGMMPDPDMKIFVISIIGLQSSGKSTLLNALFGCKFAVSVGRCTRGLFMRILFLEDELAKQLRVGAIVVLDTEGLGAPEKMNDSNSEQKDRLLATFAMSVSNLTLVNVLGESVRDLTDILQIVVITMARLEKANISPDILMVQHLSEIDSSKTMQGKEEFCNALNEAVKLTQGGSDMDLGVQNLSSLARLQRRVNTGEILKQFPPFKNGATINAPPSHQYHENVMDLYNKILQSCKDTTSPTTFHKWHEVIQEYWEAVSKQDFALRFRNIKDVQEFIERGTQIARVKETISEAFCYHREMYEVELRQEINDAKTSGGLRQWESTKKVEHVLRITTALGQVPCSVFTCGKCPRLRSVQSKLFKEVEGKPAEQETQNTINKYIRHIRESSIAHLRQMADALLVRQGLSSEHHQLIGNIVEEKLNLKAEYSDKEISEIVNEIWDRVVRKVSQALKVSSAETRIDNEICDEYNSRSPNTSANVLKGKSPDFRKERALEKSFYQSAGKLYLDQVEVAYLESLLLAIPDTILKQKNTDHFEHGMINPLRKEIDRVLDMYQKEHLNGKVLRVDFKWLVHDYTLINFMKIMVSKQVEWDKHHNPLTILRSSEAAYREEIAIRLKYGFGFEAEGRVIADLLLRAIRRKSQKAGDDAHIIRVKGEGWFTASESVRLKYFKGLADEVNKGNKVRALAHFRNPGLKIREWLQREVDSLPRDHGLKVFHETADVEYGHVQQNVFNSQTCSKVMAFVISYLNQVEGIEYSGKINFDEASHLDHNVLKGAIQKNMEKDKRRLRNINISNPSSKPEITSKLGCTQSCLLCGALCWGEEGHEYNLDNTRKHHTSHQPQGLGAVNFKSSKRLVVAACHTMDGRDWDWSKLSADGRRGTSWDELTSEPKYNGWLFTPYHKSEFNDLMSWLFVHLQADIAADLGLFEADVVEIQREGLASLPNLSHIIATINNRIGTN